MTAKELFEYLTQDAGLDDATAKAVMQAAANDKVGAKAAALVQKREYDELMERARQLEASYNGVDGKPGAKTYQKWYADNYGKIMEQSTQLARYVERFGSLEAPTTPTTPASSFSPEEVQKIVNETIQANYAPRWSDLLTKTGTLVMKHLRNGRKSDIDFAKLAELAQAKGGDLMLAYEEYDRPEAEAATKAATEAEIKRQVEERLQAERSKQLFPSGADAAGSGPAGITRSGGKDKYDRNAVIAAATTGKYDGGKETVQ